MTDNTAKFSSDMRKILLLWSLIAALAVAGVVALRLYSVQLIDRIQKSNRNEAIVGASFQLEAERHLERALNKLQTLKNAGQTPILPASDPDVTKGIDLMKRAHALQPFKPDLLSTLSDFYGMTGNEAEQLRYLGQFYLSRDNKNRNVPAALTHYERARGLQPGNRDYQHGVALCLLELNRLDEAQAILQPLVDAEGPAPESLYIMAQLSLYRKDTNAAIDWMQRAVDLNPGYIEAVKSLGQIYDWTNQPAKAVQIYQRAIPQFPNDAQLHHVLGNALMKTDQLAPARERLLEAYKINPRSAGLIMDIIRVHDRMGDEPGVKFYTSKLLDLDPEFAARMLKTEARP